MTQLLDAIVSWPSLLLVIVIFGFAPGFLLRLFVLLYEKDDPRRAELVAELYVVPRIERPIWVAEQLETALFDGLVPRIQWAMAGRITYRWKLDSGVARNKKHPDSFYLPEADEIGLIKPGSVVKLMFHQSDGWVERMWVIVDKVNGDRFVGTLDNVPLGFPRLCLGTQVKFRSKHIIDIMEEDSDPLVIEQLPDELDSAA